MTQPALVRLIGAAVAVLAALVLLGAGGAAVYAKEGPVEGAALPDASPVEPEITIARVPNTNNVALSWEHIIENSAYQVWRGTTPYFNPALGQGNQIYLWDIVSGGTLTYPETGVDYYYNPPADPQLSKVQVLGVPAVNYFWVVRGQSLDGVSGNSNRVGEFDFALVPGS